MQFLKNIGKQVQEGLEIVKASSIQLIKLIEQSIQFGKWILVENLSTYIDPNLEPILNKHIIVQGGQKIISFGDKNISYNDNFKLFMGTKIKNPHYSPEDQAKINIINFNITPIGLQDQMLAVVVMLENPEVE